MKAGAAIASFSGLGCMTVGAHLGGPKVGPVTQRICVACVSKYLNDLRFLMTLSFPSTYCYG